MDDAHRLAGALSLVSIAIGAALALVLVWHLGLRRLWFRIPRHSSPTAQAFVDYLDRPDAPLAMKITAVFAQVAANRKQQARIVAWKTLRRELGGEPSKAQLDALAQTLHDRNDSALDVTEEDIRAYLDAGGTILPDLQPWNAHAHSKTIEQISDTQFIRGCTTYIAIGEQISARVRGQSLETTDAEWARLDERVHAYLSEVLLFLDHRPKYWQRLSDRLKEPTHEKLTAPIQTADADGSVTGTYGWGHGDSLRERIDRVVQVLRAAVDGSAPDSQPESPDRFVHNVDYLTPGAVRPVAQMDPGAMTEWQALANYGTGLSLELHELDTVSLTPAEVESYVARANDFRHSVEAYSAKWYSGAGVLVGPPSVSLTIQSSMVPAPRPPWRANAIVTVEGALKWLQLVRPRP